jgi:cobalt-zinc-cadmium efflux system protein
MAEHHHALDTQLSLERGESHVHHHVGHDSEQSKLLGAVAVTFVFALIEAVTGWWSGSLALLSDAGHMITDASALGLAAFAAWLARRPPSARHSYGLVRAEVLAALFNSVLMLALIAYIVAEALTRFRNPQPVAGGVVMLVATLGLILNLFIGWILSRGTHSLNSRAALMHVMGDALGSVAAIVAGAVIYFTGWMPIDPILSIVVSMLILFSAFNLLREALHVLMEGVPPHIELGQVGLDLAAIEGVLRVHDLHVWTLSSGTIALSAHLEIQTLSDWPGIMIRAREQMDTMHSIRHTTLQPEALAPAPLLFHPQPPQQMI